MEAKQTQIDNWPQNRLKNDTQLTPDVLHIFWKPRPKSQGQRLRPRRDRDHKKSDSKSRPVSRPSLLPETLEKL